MTGMICWTVTMSTRHLALRHSTLAMQRTRAPTANRTMLAIHRIAQGKAMSILPNRPEQPGDLRLRAHASLGRKASASEVSQDATAALGVLMGMASSPATAAKALAVLHELQVHQVEMALQAEALKATQQELAHALARARQIHDCAPAALFTHDDQFRVLEANLTGASWLGVRRDALAGQCLCSYMDAPSADALSRLMQSVRLAPAGSRPATVDLVLNAGMRREVHASLAMDQIDGQYILVLMGTQETR
jgi:PAS domain-containing protein